MKWVVGLAILLLSFSANARDYTSPTPVIDQFRVENPLNIHPSAHSEVQEFVATLRKHQNPILFVLLSNLHDSNSPLRFKIRRHSAMIMVKFTLD